MSDIDHAPAQPEPPLRDSSPRLARRYIWPRTFAMIGVLGLGVALGAGSDIGGGELARGRGGVGEGSEEASFAGVEVGGFAEGRGSGSGRRGGRGAAAGGEDSWAVWGMLGNAANSALGFRRHMALYGSKSEQLGWIAKTDPRLGRGYLLKEGLRYVFAVKGKAGKEALDRWLSWARRSRIPAFVHLAKRISAIRSQIDATLEHGLSNALIESVNTKIRLITRIAFGFRSAQALIALAMLSLGGHKPTLPGRTDPRISQ